MGAVRSGSFLLTILLVLYPLGAFSEIIKPTTAMFSDAHADVNADISGTLEKEWKHEFSMATPSPDALTPDAAVEIAMDALLSRNAVIERNPQNPDHYDFLLLEVEDRALSYMAHYVAFSRGSPAAYAWIVTFFIEDTPFYVGTVTVASPDGEVIETSFGFIQQVVEIWEREKGPEFFWSIEDQYLFDQLYRNRGWNYRPALPDERDIPQDAAVAAAMEAVAQMYNLSPRLLEEEYLLSTQFCYMDARDPSSKIWRIAFRELDPATQTYALLYAVDISAADGTIVDMNDNTSGQG